MAETPEITPLLELAHRGDREAWDRLARAVQADLGRLASKLMFRRFGARAEGLTLDPSALVNETFLKLLRQKNEYKNREHFFAIATKVMLRVMMDYEKSKRRQKRGGGEQIFVTLGGLEREGGRDFTAHVPDLVEALEQLEKLDARMAKVVKLRALWGLSATETAEVLGVSRATVDRDWRDARAWLEANL